MPMAKLTPIRRTIITYVKSCNKIGDKDIQMLKKYGEKSFKVAQQQSYLNALLDITNDLDSAHDLCRTRPKV